MPNDIKIDIDGLNAEKLLDYCQQVKEPAPSLLKPIERNRNIPFLAAPAENGEIVKVGEFIPFSVNRLVCTNHNLHPAWYWWPEPKATNDEIRETVDYKFSRANRREVDGNRVVIMARGTPESSESIRLINAASFEWYEKIKHPEPKWGKEGDVKEMRREILDFKERKGLQIYETCHTNEGLGYIAMDHEGRTAALCDFADQGSAEYATLKLHIAAAKRFVETQPSRFPGGLGGYSERVAVTPEEELTRSIGTLILAKEFNVNYENKNMLAQINQAKQPFSHDKDKLHEALTSAFDDAVKRVIFLQHPRYTLKQEQKRVVQASFPSSDGLSVSTNMRRF